MQRKTEARQIQRHQMKPNNVFLVPCTDVSFYRAWIEILTPYHKLTAREKDAAARILMQYFRFKDNCQDAEVLRELLWSKRSRQDLMESLKMSRAHFQMILASLKSAGFIKDGEINPRFLPHKVEGDTRFMLQIVFDWSSKQHPVSREKE